MIVRLVVGVVLVLLGIIWFFQGIDVLGGSDMSGSGFRAIAGFIAAAIGVGLVLSARRQRADSAD